MKLAVSRLTAASTVCLLALTLAPAPALASTPLPAPINVQAVHVADTSADLWWLRDGASAQDLVERQVNGVWSESLAARRDMSAPGAAAREPGRGRGALTPPRTGQRPVRVSLGNSGGVRLS